MTTRPLVATNAFLRPRGSYSSKSPNGVTVCDKTRVFACVEEIIRCIENNVGAHVVMVPTLGDEAGVNRVLDFVNGIFLPGGYSNLHPTLYGQTPPPEGDDYAPEHDATDIALIKGAIARGIPVFGICRGMQALNVALGGSLHQRVRDAVPSTINHMCSAASDGWSYDPSEMHDITIEAGTLLHRIVGSTTAATNSIHMQAIDRLGQGLVADARAADGVIEAISLPHHPFCLGVEWHPETQTDARITQSMFNAFGDACRMHAAKA